MTAPELAESPAAARAIAPPREGHRPIHVAALMVAGLTIVGFALRYPAARQSIFADELSTYWISATHSLGGVLSLMYGTGRITHAEITPPLYFLLAWLTTRLGDSPELLRLPSLVAGTATIPVVYLLGLRAVGRRAALVAAALTALSPFMIYFSAQARAYAVMMLAVTVSTLAILEALDTGRTRWWVLYAFSACAAFYSHYTSAFVLGAQLAWVVWAHPQARRAAGVATLCAAAGVLPWVPGMINDARSPTLKILEGLSPFTLGNIRLDLGQWAVGYPDTIAGGLTKLPGLFALILLAAAACVAGWGLLAAVRGGSLRAAVAGMDRRVILVILLALATPVAEIVLGIAGDSILSVRDLGASWPYLALAGAAALTVQRSWAAALGVGLALVAFGFGAAKMLSAHFQRPDYQGAAAYVARAARPGDVVIDYNGAPSPGPLTGLDVALKRRLPVFRAAVPAERGHPFGFSDPIVPLGAAVDRAVGAARGHRVFVVTTVFTNTGLEAAARVNPVPTEFPPDYRLVGERAFPGIGDTLVAVYAHTASP